MRRKRNPASPEEELYLYTTNNGTLYKKRFGIVLDTLLKRVSNRTYKKEAAVKLWLPYVRESAGMYVREFGSDWSKKFSQSVLLAVAKELESYIKTEIDLGNYD